MSVIDYKILIFGGIKLMKHIKADCFFCDKTLKDEEIQDHFKSGDCKKKSVEYNNDRGTKYEKGNHKRQESRNADSTGLEFKTDLF
jgi:hypothetical protein